MVTQCTFVSASCPKVAITVLSMLVQVSWHSRLRATETLHQQPLRGDQSSLYGHSWVSLP